MAVGWSGSFGFAFAHETRLFRRATLSEVLLWEGNKGEEETYDLADALEVAPGAGTLAQVRVIFGVPAPFGHVLHPVHFGRRSIAVVIGMTSELWSDLKKSKGRADDRFL